jgi:hypothetical protein
MPITATFQADFSAFSTAVANAQTKLVTFEDSATKVGNSLSAMEKSISGVTIVQAATIAAEAVERLGGVTKLTDKELQRLGGTAQEAVEKMRALGQDVPVGIQKIADAARGATVATSSWGGALSTVSGVLGAFGIQASISGMVAFTKSIFDSASAIHDMGERLGISAEAVQGFKFAAEQAGSSLDTVGTAITKMNQNLAEGNKSTIEALKQAGLQFETIRAMTPEEAFLAIADAIAEIPDPMDQSKIALELFGRSAAELLPAIKEGFRQTSDSASKMSTETINALERAQDAWDIFGNQVVIISGTILANTITFVQQATKNLGNFSQFLLDTISMGPGAAATIQAMNAELEHTTAFVEPIKQLAQATKGTKDESEGAAEARKKEREATDQLARAAKEYGDILKAVEKIETDTRGKQEQGLLGLSKLQQQESQKYFESVTRGYDSIEKAQAELDDAMAKSTMTSTDYQVRKVQEGAQAKIAAFKGTSDQVAQYSQIIMTQAAREADAIIAASTRALATVSEQAVGAARAVQMAIAQIQANQAVDVVANAQAVGGRASGMQAPIYVAPPIFARAAGGPVTSGQPYMVGERGPELFVPSTSGGIVPNGRAGVVQNITIHVNGTAADVARQVSDEIMRAAMRGQQFGAS